jgi:hypothetical protein
MIGGAIERGMLVGRIGIGAGLDARISAGPGIFCAVDVGAMAFGPNRTGGGGVKGFGRLGWTVSPARSRAALPNLVAGGKMTGLVAMLEAPRERKVRADDS